MNDLNEFLVKRKDKPSKELKLCGRECMVSSERRVLCLIVIKRVYASNDPLSGDFNPKLLLYSCLCNKRKQLNVIIVIKTNEQKNLNVRRSDQGNNF